MPTDNDMIWVIPSLKGKDLDITFELTEIADIGRDLLPNGSLTPCEKQYLHELGWHLITIAGSESALSLIEDMEDAQEISPRFADLLRVRWTRIATTLAEAEAAD